MAEGQLFKPEKDYTKDVDEQVPAAEALAKTNVQGAIEKLTLLEKNTRQASDLASTSRLLVAIISIARTADDWALVNEQVLLLSKRHGQLKQATTKMVQVAMSYIDQAPDTARKLELIETLRTVTEGKIFVEVERARVTRILSNMKREQGDLKAATNTLCELQVETFGSMARREKTEFILDQVALCIENDDWTQAGILSRKISTKYFARRPPKPAEPAKSDAPSEQQDDVTDLKLRYYEQQITLAKHDDQYLEVCKHYRQVLDTPSVEKNPQQVSAVLQRVIYYILLAPFDNEQSDLLHRIHADSRNTLIPTEARLLKLFTIHELMRWPMVAEQFGPHLCSTDVFSAKEDKSEAKSHRRWNDLRQRVIQHNIRVVARYYTRIRMDRLTQLLDLEESETERYISELVTAKTIYAKIDRPARIVSFRKVRDADDVLNEWSGNMKDLLGLLDRIDHLITKEEMMASIQPQVH